MSYRLDGEKEKDMKLYIVFKDGERVFIDDIKYFSIMKHRIEGKYIKVLAIKYNWTEDIMLIPYAEIAELHADND